MLLAVDLPRMEEQLEMVEELKIHIKKRDFCALSKLLHRIQPIGGTEIDLEPETLAKRDLLLEELEIQIEDLKREAVRRFDNEEFAWCLETFEFLSRVNPSDRLVNDYLELCRQFTKEQAVHEPNPPADSSAENKTRMKVTGHEGIGRSQEAKGSDSLALKSLESHSTELTRKMKVYFDSRDFEALKQVVKEALAIDVKKVVTKESLEEVDSNRLREEQLRMAFDAHIQDLTAEAIQQFKRAAYSECLGSFRFLSELEPANLELRRYLEACLRFAREGHSDGGRLTDPTPALNSKAEGQDLAEKPAHDQSQLAFDSRAENAGKTSRVGDSGLVANDEDILEIPDYYMPDASPVRTARTSDVAPTMCNSRTAWLKPALAALGVVCLLIWLVTPRSRPELHLIPGVDDESLAAVWLQKAESAMIDRRYLTPSDDNVVLYCDRVLGGNSSNPRAMALKTESISQAVKQAEECAKKGRYDGAHELYQALLNLPRSEGLNQHDLEVSLKKVKFDSYPVVHDHFIGSCKGTLRINSYALSFVPSGGSKDGFTQQLSRIKIYGLDDSLKVEVNQKTYRFGAISGKNNRDGKTATRELHEVLSSRLQAEGFNSRIL